MGKSKRRITSLILLFVFCCLCLFACKNSETEHTANNFFNGLSVYFLDVSNSDATLFVFPDGKSMLMGTGATQKNREHIEEFINKYCENGLNYLMLTGIEGDKLINAEYFIESYSIEKAFIPFLYEACYDEYIEYKRVITKLNEKGIEYVYSENGRKVKDDDCFLGILTPYNHLNSLSVYKETAKTTSLTKDNYDDMSPVLYLEYKGVRFVLSDHAGFSQEELILSDNEAGYLNRLFDRNINLSGIDLLKVSRHGGIGASGKHYCDLLKPRYAVISVGGDNPIGNPTLDVLIRVSSNENCTFFRTDIKGDICARVSTDGILTVE